jgi:peptidyl-prolyl cis-trans isomerase C
LVIEYLLDKQVSQAGITVTDLQVDEHIARLAAEQKPPMSLQEFSELLKAYGKDVQEVKDNIKRGLAYETLIEKKFPEDLAVSEADARAYYDENQARFEQPEQVRASHILIKPEPVKAEDSAADPNEAKAAAGKRAAELLEEIRQGADFAELAKQHSQCPSSAKGGDLGFTARSDPNKGRRGWVEPFEKAAFDLEVGELSDVVETQFGYHIIKVTDHKDARKLPFEEVKSQIMEDLAKQKKAQALRGYVDSLKNSAEIVYPPEPASETERDEPNKPAETPPAEAGKQSDG